MEKDLFKQYTFPVIIARPRSFFSALFVTIAKEYENKILTDENKEYFKKIMTVEKNRRILTGYNFKKEIENIFVSDPGDIYEFDTSKFWEDKYSDISYPQFIYNFMNGNIFDSNYISNRIKLKIELDDSPRKILSEIENYLDKIFLALNKSEHSFTKEELENNLKSTFNMNNKLFIRKINNFILTYTSLVTPNYDPKNDNFLIIKKDFTNGEDKYTLYPTRFNKFKSKIISKYSEMFIINEQNRIFLKYLSKESPYLEVATLIQSLDLGTYEVTGGNASKIFIRLNDPLKIEYIAKNTNYSNKILRSIDKKGQKADQILETFFTTDMTDSERWDYIEDYFLGKI